MCRKAKIADIPKLNILINTFATQDIMLPRPVMEIIDSLREFWVYEVNNEVVACCALSIETADLAEVKCLAVSKEFQSKGIGKKLVKRCIEDAADFGTKKVFALTRTPKFFEPIGFKIIDRNDLPNKIWKECVKCMKFPDCDEIALIYGIED